MRFGEDMPSKAPAADEGDGEEGDELTAMAGKRAFAALASAIKSGDGAAGYAAFKKLSGLCAAGEDMETE